MATFARMLHRNAAGFRRDIVRIDKDLKSAGRRSVSRTSRAMATQLKKELRQGAPGGDSLEPLSEMMVAIRKLKGKTRGKKPLAGMAKLVGHKVVSNVSNNFKIDIGFVGRGKGLAEAVQKGTRQDVTPKMRRFFARLGDELPARSKFRKYMFLKKTTTTLFRPERRIIDPFWLKHEKTAINQVTTMYKKEFLRLQKR